MVTEPVIGADEHRLAEDGPRPPRPRWVAMVVGLGLAFLAVAWVGLTDDGGVDASPPGLLGAPNPVPEDPAVPILSTARAETHPGRLTWRSLPLDGSRVQAAGEIAGRLVLAIEDGDGVSRLGFLSPTGLVPGIPVGPPVERILDWNDRLLLVGGDDEGPMLRLQQADGTIRDLDRAGSDGLPSGQHLVDMTVVDGRLLGAWESEPFGPAEPVPPAVEALMVETGASFTARGDEAVLEAAPGMTIHQAPLHRPESATTGVWQSGDGVGWQQVVPSQDGELGLALLADGRGLVSWNEGALATSDGASWTPFPVPLGLEAAHGRHHLWSMGPFGNTIVMFSSDARAWQPVDLAPLAPEASWTIRTLAAGPAGYAVELTARPDPVVEVDTRAPGVQLLVADDYANLRLADGTVLTSGRYRSRVDIGSRTVSFSWGADRSTTVDLVELMEADARRSGARLVFTSADGLRWAPAPVGDGTAPAGVWVSDSTVVVDDGDHLLVGVPG